MAERQVDYSQFEFDTSNLENNIDLGYTQRNNQVSIIVTQDPRKEGILSFFENTNYNNIYNTLGSSGDSQQPTPSTTTTSSPASNTGMSGGY